MENWELRAILAQTSVPLHWYRALRDYSITASLQADSSIFHYERGGEPLERNYKSITF